MGCGGSKMDAVEEAGEGLRIVRRKVEEIRRRRFGAGGRWFRKDSIVSTTGLLRPEEEEDDAATEDDSTVGSRRDGNLRRAGEAPPPIPAEIVGVPNSSETVVTAPPTLVVERKSTQEVAASEKSGNSGVPPADSGGTTSNEKGEKNHEKEVGRKEKAASDTKEEEKDHGDGELDGAALRRRSVSHSPYDEEELPGSPSFRVYFVDSGGGDDDDSVNGKANSKEETERDDSSFDTSNLEGTDCKAAKKQRGKRFKALVARGLHVRACISHQNGGGSGSSSPHDVAAANQVARVNARSCQGHGGSPSEQSPSLIPAKAA